MCRCMPALQPRPRRRPRASSCQTPPQRARYRLAPRCALRFMHLSGGGWSVFRAPASRTQSRIVLMCRPPRTRLSTLLAEYDSSPDERGPAGHEGREVCEAEQTDAAPPMTALHLQDVVGKDDQPGAEEEP